MLEIRNYILEHRLVEKGDDILVGLSGGPDSVFLLYALDMFKESLGYSLHAVHVHHGIRGEEADRDMKFSEELCNNLEIPFKKVFVDAPKLAGEKGMSLEEAARILRYEAFETTRKEIEDKLTAVTGGQETENSRCLIAVAHHMDDQAETVLHNLVRGSGIRGLSGMEPKRGFIIRPLLSVKREYILSKLKDNGIPYVIDSTNLDTRYTRNHIRSEILPGLREINPEASSHIARTADILREADDFFGRLASMYVDKYAEIRNGEMTGQEGTEISLPVTELKTYPELVRQYVMIELIRRIGTPLKDWGAVHFRDMDKLIHGPGNAHLDLPYKMSADYRKKRLILRINQEIFSIKRRKNNDGASKSSDS
ncbi:tRNA lysidine(34) synthetase TilS [Oribacterium sp. P6A1]|uniref:tRNA lysidine(34) synthetase TilS n=1 Tax=Oribacterium sp. P6A1 TaxID=1410612 RepID=UPI0018CBFAD2|nr:tRNA lysidine(34) synthetase TilS [Oribacterium sp. P6A1]